MKIELERTDRVALPTGVLDLAMRSDGRTMIAACMDGLYQLSLPALPPPGSKSEGKPVPRRVARHDSYVSSVAIDEKNATLLSAAYDGTLHIRDLRDLPETELPAAAVKPDNDARPVPPDEASAQEGGAAADAASESAPQTSGEIPARIAKRIHRFWSWDMALSPDKRLLASVSGQYLAGSEDYAPLPADEPTVKILDAVSGAELHGLDMLPSVQCVAFDSSSRYVAAGNLMGDVCVWDAGSGEKLAHWRTESFTSWGIIKSHCYIGGIFALSFSPDGESLYVAGMGDMRDPMAGNGKQLWQRFHWRKSPAEKTQETVPDQAGEGLMETLAWHPSGDCFVMGGRLRGGNWNLGIFATDTGQLIGQAKTGMRITTARFDADGSSLLLAGMQGQPAPKKDHFPDFGYVERYRVTRA